MNAEDDECICGGRACYTWYTENGGRKYRIFCTKCGWQTRAYSTKEEAEKEWKAKSRMEWYQSQSQSETCRNVRK